jgi:cation-transporting P-type ATPase 13A2
MYVPCLYLSTVPVSQFEFLLAFGSSKDTLGLDRESTDLVPGDIVRLSQAQFLFFPADMFLLSGDAIVNESMLTGESVPVSKIPVRDADIAQWKDTKDVSGDAAKSFLYSGTRVVRIRGSLTYDDDQGPPALALVVRTGEDHFCIENMSPLLF